MEAADIALSAYSARSRTAASRVHLPGGWFGRAKQRGIKTACFLLLVTVVGTDVG